MADYDAVEAKVDAIEAEMKKIGYWSSKPLPKEAYNFNMAFGLDMMPLANWVQFILIPRVREIIAEKGSFPPRSNVGAQAVREYDTDHDTSELVKLLIEFDDLITT